MNAKQLKADAIKLASPCRYHRSAISGLSVTTHLSFGDVATTIMACSRLRCKDGYICWFEMDGERISANALNKLLKDL